MKIEDLGNGYVRLTAKYGVVHKASRIVYSEVVCKEKDVYRYEAVGEPNVD